MTDRPELMLLLGRTSDKQYARVDLVYYGKPPSGLYIFPKEGWHLLARTGYDEWNGMSWQDTEFDRTFICTDYRVAVEHVLRNFSKVEKLFELAIDKLMKPAGMRTFSVTLDFKEILSRSGQLEASNETV